MLNSRSIAFVTFVILSISVIYTYLHNSFPKIVAELKNPMSAVRIPSVSKPASAAVIIFHGLGDSGNGWKFYGDLARQSSDFDHINFIFPNAPVMKVTATGGRNMPAWFDIIQFGGDINKQDTTGYANALDTVEKYIDEQIQLGIKSDRIIVGGFSQGGGIALGSLVKTEKKLGGILALSPAVRFYSVLRDLKKDINLDTPVFHGHGDADQMISKEVSDANVEFFTKELGYTNYNYNVYPGLQHTSGQEELKNSFDFIRKVLPKL